MMWMYSAVVGVGLVLAAPWWLLRMATTQRYREGLRQRLGAVPAALRAIVAGKRVVWVHAVSVGEVLAVSRLVGALGAELGGESVVVVSTTTRTGQALARERFGAERVFFFPLDFAWAVRAYLQALRPALVVLAEGELWPRMLHECGRAGVPVAVVNARVSDRSFRRAMRVRRVWGRVLGRVVLFLAQSAEDARRLEALGARDVRVSGNLKYDVRAAPGSRLVSSIGQQAAGRKVIVAGSLVEDQGCPEASAVLRAWAAIPGDGKDVFLILAPRHPENFDRVSSMAGEFGTLRATELLRGGDSAEGSSVLPGEGERRPAQVLVLDTIGDLAAVYGLADVAFVGGSLVPRGGHNPLEPAQFGVPVVLGPFYDNFRDIVEKMRAEEAVRIVHNDRELTEGLGELLARPAEAGAMGERGRQVFEREGGATVRSIEALMALLGQSRGQAGETKAVRA